MLAYFAPAGERPAGRGLSGDSGERGLSRRHARDDGQQRGHAAGTAVHADSRPGDGDFEQRPGPHQLHAAVRSVQEPRRGGDRRADGHHPGDGQVAGRPAEPADVHQNESERSADHVHRA